MKSRKLLPFHIFRSLVLSFFLLTFFPALFALDGAGTEADPFLIATATDLVEFSNYAANDNSYYKLTADIDMTGQTYTSNVNVFKGFIEGDGHVIRNLTITANTSPAGFVSNKTGGGIQNLGFENLTIENSSKNLLAGITGRVNTSVPAAYYRNIYIKGGTISGAGVAVGGIVAKNNSSVGLEISNCYVDAVITGTQVTGGIMGLTTRSTSVPESCAFYGTITDSGANYGPIMGKGQAESDLEGKNNHAIVGYITKGTGAALTGVIDVAAADIANQSAYSLDFVTHWYMGTNYPELLMFNTEVATDTSSIAYMNVEAHQNLNNPSTYTDIQAISLVDPSMDSTGYAFVGWFTDEALTIPVSVPAIEKGSTDDKVFYAKWAAVTVSYITYMNIGTVSHDNPSTYNTLEEITLSVPTGDSAASVFVGWYTGEELTIPVSVPAITLGTTGDKIFYAKWQGVFAVTSLTWGDGTTAQKDIVQFTEATVTISYANPTGADSLFMLVSHKDSWGTIVLAENIVFPIGQTEVDVSFTVRQFSPAVPVDPNVFRVNLGPEATSLWGARYDILSDGNGGNDAVYGEIVESASSVNDVQMTKTLVYPNPSQGLINVVLKEESSLEVYNLAGQLVFAQQAVAGTQILDFSTFNSGLYLLIVEGKSRSETIKLQKQ